MKIKIKYLHPNAQKWGAPKPQTFASAGVDLFACLEKDVLLPAGGVELVPTGIAIFIEQVGFAGMILPRSGLGHKHGVVLGNLVGLIDADYQGELKISCWNRSKNDFLIESGARIAQLVIVPVVTPEFTPVDDFEESHRGKGGFGHTGV